MKERVKDILIDLGLIATIFMLVVIFHAVFIAGPRRAYEHEDALYVRAFEDYKRLSNLNLENRFHYDDTYYIVSDTSKKTLYWFRKNLEEVGSQPYASLDAVLNKAVEWQFDPESIRYGVYNERIVYSLEDGRRIVFVDMETFEVLFSYGGSI